MLCVYIRVRLEDFSGTSSSIRSSSSTSTAMSSSSATRRWRSVIAATSSSSGDADAPAGGEGLPLVAPEHAAARDAVDAGASEARVCDAYRAEGGACHTAALAAVASGAIGAAAADEELAGATSDGHDVRSRSSRSYTSGFSHASVNALLVRSGEDWIITDLLGKLRIKLDFVTLGLKVRIYKHS